MCTPIGVSIVSFRSIDSLETRSRSVATSFLPWFVWAIAMNRFGFPGIDQRKLKAQRMASSIIMTNSAFNNSLELEILD